MAREYINGRWVEVADTTDGGSALNASTGTIPNGGSTTTTGTGDKSTQGYKTSDREGDEVSYDIISGTGEVKKANMRLRCRNSVQLKGLGDVFCGTYRITGMKITLSNSSMKQTIDVHRDSILETF